MQCKVASEEVQEGEPHTGSNGRENFCPSHVYNIVCVNVCEIKG